MTRRKSKPEPDRLAVIAVLPMGPVAEDVARVLSDSLQGILRVPVRLLPSVPIPDEAFLEHRRQYNAMAILRHLTDHHANPSIKTLAIMEKDLCNPILTYVFGEAYLDGAAAVMSCHRLYRGPAYQPVSREQFLERVVKVGLHEIGHTFNLPHCHTGRCVMRAANTIAELDDKLNYLCNYCQLFFLEALQEAVRQTGH